LAINSGVILGRVYQTYSSPQAHKGSYILVGRSISGKFNIARVHIIGQYKIEWPHAVAIRRPGKGVHKIIHGLLAMAYSRQ